MQYSALIQIKTNNTSGTIYTQPVAKQSTKGGQAFIRGGQSLKLSTKTAVFIRISLLIGGAKHVDRGRQAPLPPDAGPDSQ